MIKIPYISYSKYMEFAESENTGQIIEKNDWDYYRRRAKAQMNRYMMDYDIRPLTDDITQITEFFSLFDDIVRAVCAMAEVYAIHDQDFSTASIGSVHVSYAGAKTNLQRELYRAARQYLDIRRGVS